MLLPFKAKNPPESTPWGTIILIVVNVAIFIMTSKYGLVARKDVVMEFGLSGNNSGFVNWITSIFLHGDIFHLLGNMWFLYLFGFAVEGRLRTGKFLLLYFLAGFAGSAAHFFMFSVGQPEIPSLGASGAIMGLLGASLYMFPFAQVAFWFGFGFFLSSVFVWPMWGVALYYLGFDVVFAIISAGDGIAHLAHIGGALGGFLVAFALRPQRDTADASEAKATLSEVNDLGILSSRELASMHASNPEDSLIALHWMHRSIRDPYGVKPDCQAAFLRLLPKMIREHEPTSIAFCVGTVAATPGLIAPSLVGDLASRLERNGEYAMAVRLFELVIADPASRPADVESALFRIGILCETALGNPIRAHASYLEVVRRFGLSPMADQAKARAKGMESRGFSAGPN